MANASDLTFNRLFHFKHLFGSISKFQFFGRIIPLPCNVTLSYWWYLMDFAKILVWDLPSLYQFILHCWSPTMNCGILKIFSGNLPVQLHLNQLSRGCVRPLSYNPFYFYCVFWASARLDVPSRLLFPKHFPICFVFFNFMSVLLEFSCIWGEKNKQEQKLPLDNHFLNQGHCY